MSDGIESRLREDRRFSPSSAFVQRARIASRDAYQALYRQSIEDPDTFWKEQTAELAWRSTVHWPISGAALIVGAAVGVLLTLMPVLALLAR